jgi:hypothetical protein
VVLEADYNKTRDKPTLSAPRIARGLNPTQPDGFLGWAGLYRRANPDPRGWVTCGTKPDPARPISRPKLRYIKKPLRRTHILNKGLSMFKKAVNSYKQIRSNYKSAVTRRLIISVRCSP